MPAFAVDMAAPPQQLVLIMFPAEAQPEMNPDTVFGLEMKARGPGPVVPYAGPVNTVSTAKHLHVRARKTIPSWALAPRPARCSGGKLRSRSGFLLRVHGQRNSVYRELQRCMFAPIY